MIAVLPVLAQDAAISAERIREHTRFLASDLLEGRGVGQRGGELATEYIATQFALAGAKPAGDNGTYLPEGAAGGHRDPAGRHAERRGTGQERGPSAGATISSAPAETQQPDTRFEAEAVFVGHGITAPEFEWDDYKGVDVKGKVVVLFTNEPPSTDPKFFDGRALTYYGRWTYKYEEALRRGARACIIIHTTPTAGYGWDVVRNSWGREAPFVKLEPGEQALSLAGWITREAGEKLLALAGKNRRRAAGGERARDFRPIALGMRIRGHMPVEGPRPSRRRNVAAMIPGSDPKLKDEVRHLQRALGPPGIGSR